MLSQWLGFSLTRNPFVVPIKLDERPETPRVMRSHMEQNKVNVSAGGGKSTERTEMMGTTPGMDGFHVSSRNYTSLSQPLCSHNQCAGDWR